MATRDASSTKNNFAGAIIGLGIIVVLIFGGLYYLDAFPLSTQEPDITPTPIATQSRLSLVLDNLPAISNGFYHLWIEAEDESFGNQGLLSVGAFTVNEEGQLMTVDGGVVINNEFAMTEDLADVSGTLLLTVEELGDVDDQPSNTILLQGELRDGIGSLEFVNETMTDATGQYLLATPSDGPNTNETSGVWFIEITDGEEIAGLQLPEAPTGWIYEGWVSNGLDILTVGQFATGDTADNFSEYNAEGDVPPFPGEDFLVNPPETYEFPYDLAVDGTRVFITLEPEFKPAGDESILSLDILEGSLSAGSQAAAPYQLDNIADSHLPSGLVIIRR